MFVSPFAARRTPNHTVTCLHDSWEVLQRSAAVGSFELVCGERTCITNDAPEGPGMWERSHMAVSWGVEHHTEKPFTWLDG